MLSRAQAGVSWLIAETRETVETSKQRGRVRADRRLCRHSLFIQLSEK
jgi:hypothetical protein